MLSVIKQLQIDKRIRVGYGTAIILLIISYLLTLYAHKQLMDQTKTIIVTNKAIIHLEDLTSYLRDAETGVTGYLLMNDKKFLAPYLESNKKADSIFLLLKDEAPDVNTNHDNIKDLKRLVAKKYQYLAFRMQYFSQHVLDTFDTISIVNANNKVVTDSISNLVKNIQLEKTNLLVQKTEILSNRYGIVNLFITTSLVFVFLFAFFGFITYTRENKARKIADKQVIEFQEQLQLRIDELDAANKELVQMKRLEKFAATGRIARSIAHEVRNPLTNIDLAIGQIRSETVSNDENSAMLFDMVNRNSRRINQLITELLNATRFAELNSLPVSINVILDEALELAKDRIALKHIEVQKNYDFKMCDISADKEKLKIAFLNIIVNAVEAIETKSGLLIINTKGEEDKCVVEIIDNGIGMDATALSKLFEPYFTTKQKGNGLGLTNTQNIILNHKGSINVESIPGRGTTFVVRFYFNTEQ